MCIVATSCMVANVGENTECKRQISTLKPSDGDVQLVGSLWHNQDVVPSCHPSILGLVAET